MAVMRAVRLLTALSVVLLGGGVAVPAPASAAVRDVRLTQDGASPERLQVGPGDTVRFVNADTFVHRVVDAGGDWDFDTGTVLPGRAYTLAEPLAQPGTFAYRGAGLDRFTGVVVVPGVRSTSPSPGPSPTTAPAAAAALDPTPAPTDGGGRLAGPPPLAGSSFGGVDGLAPQAQAVPVPPRAPGPEPAYDLQPAPDLQPTAGPGLDVAGRATGATAPPLAAGQDGDPRPATRPLPRLSSPVEARRFGLPLVLATVLIGGVLSLLVRLLLAEPARGAGAGGAPREHLRHAVGRW